MTERFAADDLRELARGMLIAAGQCETHAQDVAETLVEADLLGYTTHGLQFLPQYCSALESGAMTPDGEVVRSTPEDATPSYRHIGLPEDWIFLGGRFTAPDGDPTAVEREHLERRRAKVETQVYELPSCGSTWKNPGPPHGSAWQLVEGAGMRGAVRGGAQITERHANFIANLGGATASDVLELMAETRRRVHETAGIWLEPEIRLWGFDAEELASVGGAV